MHSGALTAGALIAYLLYIDMLFSPVQMLSQVFDGYQQASVARPPHLRAAADAHLDPAGPRPRQLPPARRGGAGSSCVTCTSATQRAGPRRWPG